MISGAEPKCDTRDWVAFRTGGKLCKIFAFPATGEMIDVVGAIRHRRHDCSGTQLVTDLINLYYHQINRAMYGWADRWAETVESRYSDRE